MKSSAAMKKRLGDVAREYAHEIKRRPEKKTKCEHVVAVLTRQHGGAFPVAVNSGTRPAVCKVLKEELGTDYEATCVAAENHPPSDVPELRTVSGKPPVAVPTVKSLRARFPNARALLHDGAQRIALLSNEEVLYLTREIEGHGVEPKSAKSLSPTQGNGRHGRYHTMVLPLPPMLQAIAAAAKEWIETLAGPLKSGLGSKTLLLRYGLGGVNFAHHDACGDFQALLMLSTPGADFGGGSFYLADRNPPFTVKEFPFSAAGELLVFRGNRGHGNVDYLHGMREVTAGTETVTRRFGVGLFQ